MEQKNAFVAQVLCSHMLGFEVSKSNSNILMRNNFFFENYVTSEGAVSLNVIWYYQQLSIARYQVSWYAYNDFE